MNASVRSWKWYRLPAAVFLVGMFSIILLFGLERIWEQQVIYSTLIDAILDIEIKTATFHLQIEEFVAGDRAVDFRGAAADIDQAISLAEVVLNTVAVPRRGVIPEPTNGPGLGTRAQELKSLLESLKFKGVVLGQEAEETGINSPADREFDAVYGGTLAKATVLGDIFKTARAENRRKIRRLFLGMVIVWTLALITATLALWRIEMRRKAAEESLLAAHRQLLAQAEELTAHRENLAGLVERRTAELTAANGQLRVEIAERRQAEASLKESERHVRALSFRLLRAQEIERRRISMELHDELGQALNVMKLRIRLIEKGLGEAEGAAREDCEGLLDYLDEVIESVRRLSLDLSPAILEDLGLTAALRWLVSDFRRIQAVAVNEEIAEIDDLFPENHRITIYRVVQEALTNVGKHAEAGNVAVTIRRLGDRVTFAVEDDGRGFDPLEIAKKDASERGLGLTTMGERVRMMGGVFEVWSRPGEGTRITFSIPVGKEVG